MKKLTLVLAISALSSSFALAEDLSSYSDRNAPVTTANASQGRDVTGFSSQGAPAINPESGKLNPNPHPNLQPRTGGIFSDGVKYGTVMISPTAPAAYGQGEKYLAAPSARFDLQHESGPAAHRETGGFKLFSVEF